MLEYKKNPRAHIVSKFIVTGSVALMLFAVLVLTGRAAWSMYGRFADASAAAEASEQELVQLEIQKANVTTAIDELSSPQGVEKHLRERFGVAKPGENEIRIVRKSGAGDDVTLENDQNIFVRMFRALLVW